MVPALSVEEIRERLLGDGAVEKLLANSLRKIKDSTPAGVKRGFMFKLRTLHTRTNGVASAEQHGIGEESARVRRPSSGGATGASRCWRAG